MLLAGGVATCALVALAFWLWPGAPAPSSQPAGLAPARLPSAAPAPAAARTQPEASAEHAEHAEQEAHEHAPPPSGDLLHYAAKPMSAVPHRVIRGWGASGGRDKPGLVGTYVIVEPGISDEWKSGKMKFSMSG